MDLGLKGRRALVTGSTLGIGYAIAETLAREGAKVIINGRSQASVDRAVTRIRDAVGTADVASVAADGGTEAGAAAIVAAFPEIDILVNNLGIYEPKRFFEVEDAEWRHFFEVNVLSGIRFARAYAPGMKARGWGRVLFISSESALAIPPEMIHYGATKTMQLAVSRGLAMELGGTGVTVNAVLPGPTRTEGVAEFVAGNARQAGTTPEAVERDFFKILRPNSLLQRFIQPQEVANLAVYLCGTGASATTGAALRVEGGVVNFVA